MKKKSFLLPIFAGLLLSSCKFTIFGKTIYLFEKKPDKPDDSGEVVPEDPNQHASKLTIDPSAPFYLKIGETRQISVGFDHTPTLDSERLFYWSFNNNKISINVDGQTGTNVKGGQKCFVTGLNAGTALLRVTNTYNQSLVREFTIHVIEFDEDKDYLWQYTSEDRKQFGYNSQTAKQGIKEGDAVLNGMTWHFRRSATTSLQSSMGAVGFGKNAEPETAIHLETMSDRVVKDFTIEAASANSLATMRIKVNGVDYPLNQADLVDGKVSRAIYDVISPIHTTGVGEEKGKIEIDFSTPPYNPAQADDPEYKVPGAVYLKSILIHFGDAAPAVTTETFDFKEMYDDPEDGYFDTLTTTAKADSVSKNDFTVYFDKIKKESTSSEKIPGYAHTNSYIDITLTKPNEVIASIEFKFTYGTSSSHNVYSLNKSKSGGAPYIATGISSDTANEILKANIFDEHCNALRLTNQNTYNIGLEYLVIKTKSGVNPTIKEIEVPEEFVPVKKDYIVGEVFSTEGLPNLSIIYNEDGIESDELSPDSLDWFDGVSYDANPNTATKELAVGTTYVYGIFRGEKVVKITDLTVADSPQSLTLVKSASEISSTGKYFLIEKTSKTIIKGSAGSNMGKSSGIATLSLTSIGDEITIPGLYKDDYYTLTETSGLYAIKSTTGNHFGITTTGNLSTAQNPNGTKNASIVIDSETGIATIRYDYTGATPKTGYLYFDGAIKISAEEVANLSLYKLA